jgi:signal transduction histidine kinase
MIPSLLRLAKNRQTRLNTLYLLLSFPLGLVYFVFLIVGLATGVATTVIWLGLVILWLVLMGWWQLASFERKMTMAWLNVNIPPMTIFIDPRKTRWERLRAQLGNSVTWKSLLYLLMKFLFGVLALNIVLSMPLLVLCISIVSTILGLLITPFVYIAMVIRRRTRGVIFTQSPLLYISMQRPDANSHTTSFRQMLLICMTCGGLIFVPFYVINAAAWAWGQFARVMLGVSDNEIRVAQAEALAAQERAKAERAEQSRRELIVNVSHELRTPVASIRGHLEALLKTYEEGGDRTNSPEALHKYLTIVHRESVRLGALVDDLLSLARTEASELRLQIEAVDAGEVVEEVYQTLMPLARRERLITIVCSVAPGLPLVRADRQRLTQVLLNLVRNAITYTPDGGIVSITLKRASAHNLELSVADTGIGIPPEDLERVFERFYRTDASRARTSGGFGLGLAIVRDLVNAMGGSVSVASRVGEGSCFRVLLCIA